ncbi:MAG: hydroxyacid dehydrogenase [Pseudomonadota bacterium]|nr:hydroxyacid dehydrogenase [Pseudomonadota bacterium]
MILITEFMDELSVQKLENRYEVIYDPSLVNNQKQITRLIKDSQAIIVRNKTLVTRELIEFAPNLLCVGRLGVGLDNIDTKACKDRKIAVYPATGANARSVAEYVICTAMVLFRGAFNKNSEILSGQWPRQESSGLELCGKIIGLIGFGQIAQRLRTLATALGMEVVAYDPYLSSDAKVWEDTQKVSLDKLLTVSDVISLHVPLTTETRNLIDKKRLRLVKRSSVLINSARGGIVNEQELAFAIKEGRILGAALDVFSKEPLNVELANHFKGLPNIILTPHIAGVTRESNLRVSELVAKRIDEHLSNL